MTTPPVIEELIQQIDELYKYAGLPDVPFNATEWTLNWLNQSCPVLDHHKPIEYLDTPEGIVRIKQIIACIPSGAYL